MVASDVLLYFFVRPLLNNLIHMYIFHAEDKVSSSILIIFCCRLTPDMDAEFICAKNMKMQK
jgi:hypothetical protein